MLKQIPKFTKKNGFEERYKALDKKDKNILDNYAQYCSINANEEKVQDMKRNVLKFKLIIQKSFEEIGLEELRGYLAVLNKSKLSDYSKNDHKVHVKKFLKWKFKDWSATFNEFEDIKQNSSPLRQRKIRDKILTKQDIEKLVKTETKMFWKAFLLVQYEGALRTKEVRFLKWKDLKEEGEFYTIDLFSTKTKREKPIVLKEAKFYLDKLNEEQTNLKQKGEFIFHSKRDFNAPIDKGTVSSWMRTLSKKALGKEIWAYILRHTRATELRKLVKEGKLSTDNAVEMLGHSEKIFHKTYSHLETEDVKEMLKNQLFNFEDIPEEKKHKLEEQIESLQTKMDLMENQMKFFSQDLFSTEKDLIAKAEDGSIPKEEVDFVLQEIDKAKKLMIKHKLS